MSENTANAALCRLGYAVGDMTGHGFRSMASTLLNEQGWNRDIIERRQVCRGGVCPACLREEDAENHGPRIELTARRYRALLNSRREP